MPIDFQAEGLLEGVEGEAREERLALLSELAEEGASLEEMRDAVAAGRLTLLPVERALAGGGAATRHGRSREIAEIDLGLLQRFSAALGIPFADPDAPQPDRRRHRGRLPHQGVPRSRPSRRRNAAGRAARSAWGWHASPRPTGRSWSAR